MTHSAFKENSDYVVEVIKGDRNETYMAKSDVRTIFALFLVPLITFRRVKRFPQKRPRHCNATEREHAPPGKYYAQLSFLTTGPTKYLVCVGDHLLDDEVAHMGLL